MWHFGRTSSRASRQMPLNGMCGMMSQPYMCGALRKNSWFAPPPIIQPSSPGILSRAARPTGRISTCTVFSAPTRILSVTSNSCGMSMLSASPIFSPLRNTSASVSMPSNTSTARSPGSRAGQRNVFV